MWKNYLKTSVRNLIKHRSTTLISTAGLNISFVCSFILLQYIHFESTYDDFHSAETYRLTHNMSSPSGNATSAETFLGVQNGIEDGVAGINEVLQINRMGTAVIEVGDSVFRNDRMYFASPNFFTFFNYQMIDGAFNNDPKSVVLSKSIADHLFGKKSPVGEFITVQNLFGVDILLGVAGVYQDFPDNTHINAELIVPMSTLLDRVDTNRPFGQQLGIPQLNWLWKNFHTYIKKSAAVNVQDVSREINRIIENNRAARNAQVNQQHEIFLQPVSGIHTRTGIEGELSGTIDQSILNLFSAVGLLILLIGWINYINLSTARSITRGREVGIRKVLGASLIQLKIQFQVETLILSLFSFAMAVVIIIMMQFYLENIGGFGFIAAFSPFTLLFLFSVLVGSVLASAYPSYILSQFQPVKILKGKYSTSSRGILLRRLLIGIQLSITIGMLTGLYIIHNQVDHMISYDKGIDVEDRLAIFNATVGSTADRNSRVQTIKNEFLNVEGIEDITISTLTPGVRVGWQQTTNGQENSVMVDRAAVDYGYFDFYNIQLKAGRHFNKQFTQLSESAKVILNETAARQFGFIETQTAIGQRLGFLDQKVEVIGVVEDYYQRGVHFSISPMLFSLDTLSNSARRTIAVKTTGSSREEVLRSCQKLYQEFFPTSPFEHEWIETLYQDQYTTQSELRIFLATFVGICISIAVFGLIGLTSFTVAQRLKEISIRKVLGATRSGLILVLNKELFFILLGAIAISLPITTYYFQDWLNEFPNRIELSVGHFIYPSIIVGLVGVLTTISQILSVIDRDPAKVLNEEG